MARTARIIYPGLPHHITQRGNNKQTVFRQDLDYLTFTKYLKEGLLAHHLKVIAYCLMPNHYHMILTPQTKDQLAKALRYTHLKYTQYFNKKYKRSGLLWQGRYYSCPMGKTHLFNAVRYVENNPTRAKITTNDFEWKHSSALDHSNQRKSYLPFENIQNYLKITNWHEYLNIPMDESFQNKFQKATQLGRLLK